MEMLLDRHRSSELDGEQRSKPRRFDAGHRLMRILPLPAPAANPDPQADLLHAAHASLQTAPSQAIRSLRCVLVDGALEIGGKVPTYYQKQIAQELIRRQLPTIQVNNRVQVG